MGRVTICGIDTSALPKLNSKECDALLKKIKAGDKEARDLFLRANMRLVLSCERERERTSARAKNFMLFGNETSGRNGRIAESA